MSDFCQTWMVFPTSLTKRDKTVFVPLAYISNHFVMTYLMSVQNAHACQATTFSRSCTDKRANILVHVAVNNLSAPELFVNIVTCSCTAVYFIVNCHLLGQNI